MRSERQVLCQSRRPRAAERYSAAVKADLTLINQNVEGKKTPASVLKCNLTV